MSKTLILTNKSHILHYIKAARGRTPFRNSNGTFVGIAPTDLVRAGLSKAIRGDNESLIAYILDDPDYIIMSNGVPMAWHSPNRGIESKAKGPNPEHHTWVIRRFNPDEKIRLAHYNTTVSIVKALNREADND